MRQELYREKNTHGSVFFPFECYIQKSYEPMLVTNYHWHEEMEWIYLIQGKIIVEIDMQTFCAGPGSLICIPRESLHKIKTEGPSLYYAFVFKFQFLQFSLYDYCESNYMAPLEKGEMVFSQYNDLSEMDHLVRSELELIVEAYLQKEVAWQLIVKSSLTKIVALLIRRNALERAEDGTDSNQAGKVENIKLLIFYMKEHYQEKIYIKELADLVSMNETYLCRYFKNATGKTPIEYINHLRIEKAAKLILESDYRIIDICFMVGFENVSYFIRKFKEVKSLTPKKYADKMKMTIEQ